MGRPTEYSAEVADVILAAIREGNHPSVAAQAAGISPRTLRRWRQRGRAGEEPYSDFVHRLTEAESQAETALVSIVRKAAEIESKCAMWLLSSRYPERWSSHRREIDELRKALTERLQETLRLEAAIKELQASRLRGGHPVTPPTPPVPPKSD